MHRLNVSLEQRSQQQQQNQRQYIIITKCPTETCSGFYTDTLSESIVIECKDPRHHNDNKIVMEKA
jgi:hypothetical protein